MDHNPLSQMDNKTETTMDQKRPIIYSDYKIVTGQPTHVTTETKKLLALGWTLAGTLAVVAPAGSWFDAHVAQALVLPVPLVPLDQLLPPPPQSEASLETNLS
jgi:hypothetical protein